ncbi:MAG: protein kinase [Gemmatimonadaceae bacterium]
MTATSGTRGTSLTWKIFLTTAGVVAAVLVATLVLTSLSAERAADDAVARGLGLTRRLVTAILNGRERRIASAALVFVQSPSPAFRKLLVEKRPEDLHDQATEAVERIGAAWVQFTDAEGVRLARSDDPAAPADTLTGSALIAAALAGDVASGAGTTGDSAIFQAVAVPIVTDRLVGVLMAVEMLDSALADSVKRLTGSDVVFYVADSAGRPHIAASTLGRGEAVARFVERHWATPTAASDLALGDERYVGQGQPLRSAGGDVLGGFIALRSRDAEMAPFVTLRRNTFLAGALGLALAFVLSYAMAQRITHPILALAGAARRVAEGDYSADVSVQTGDEIGTLADAVRTMLADLREKQSLVEFLATSGNAAGAGGGAALTTPRDTAARHAITAPMAAVGGATVTVGTVLAGRYEITGSLGSGGAGTVYKATDRDLGETIAIKTLKPEALWEDPAALERLKSEIRLARRISHRNVVRTHDFGEAEGVYFLTMEFVAGTPLDQLIARSGRVPIPVTFSVGKQLCRALEVAHEAGIIHRDIKPQNLMVQPDGVLKVMDFGVARLARRTAGLTRAGTVVGTLAYMSPEQLLDEDVDPRADIYSAGVVMYECLTGRRPLEASSPVALIGRLLAERPPAPREVNGEVPLPLSDLVSRAIATDRDARPRSAAALHELLIAAEGDGRGGALPATQGVKQS